MEIYNKTLKQEIVDGLVSKIKEKKELVNLDEQICVETLEQFFMEHPRALKKLAEVEDVSKVGRSKEFQEAVKWVRNKVRQFYGLFQTVDLEKAGALLDDIENTLMSDGLNYTLDIHNMLLSTHVSTQERLEIYPEFYDKIFSVTGVPKVIFEIGCGFNPFSLPYMNIDSLHYIATELNKDDVGLIKRYFEMISGTTSVKGEAFCLDLTKEPKKIAEYRADILFALKLFDLLDNKLAEQIVVDADVDWIVASFPTKTVTKLDMRFKRRAGFQKMLRRLELKYQTIEFNNELVYIIDKRK